MLAFLIGKIIYLFHLFSSICWDWSMCWENIFCLENKSVKKYLPCKKKVLFCWKTSRIHHPVTTVCLAVTGSPNKHGFNYPRDAMSGVCYTFRCNRQSFVSCKIFNRRNCARTAWLARFSRNLWTAHVGAYRFPQSIPIILFNSSNASDWIFATIINKGRESAFCIVLYVPNKAGIVVAIDTKVSQIMSLR